MSLEWVVLDIGGEKFHAKESADNFIFHTSYHPREYCCIRFRGKSSLNFLGPGLAR